MQPALLVSFCWVGLGTTGDLPPISPTEAVHRINAHVTVEMVVRAAKNRLEKRGEIYLDSETDFHDPKNLGIIITRAGAAKFRRAGIADPAAHFQGKTIRVRGTVLLKDQRPRIEVNAPEQIELVKTSPCNEHAQGLPITTGMAAPDCRAEVRAAAGQMAQPPRLCRAGRQLPRSRDGALGGGVRHFEQPTPVLGFVACPAAPGI
jgi:hypothetical protein